MVSAKATAPQMHHFKLIDDAVITLAPVSRGTRLGVASDKVGAPLQCIADGDQKLEQFKVIVDATETGKYGFTLMGTHTSFFFGQARHLSAEPDGTVTTDKVPIRQFEKFSVFKVEGGVAIQCHHGTYLGVNANGEVRCDFPEVTPESTFIVRMEVADGHFELLAH